MTIRRSRYKKVSVDYVLRGSNGYIIELREKFFTFKQAIEFVREVKQSGKLIGKPIIDEKQ